MTCNCRNTDELRIVRGNAFAIRLTVTAIHIDGTPVENFVLGEASPVLKVMHLDTKTEKDHPMERIPFLHQTGSFFPGSRFYFGIYHDAEF